MPLSASLYALSRPNVRGRVERVSIVRLTFAAAFLLIIQPALTGSTAAAAAATPALAQDDRGANKAADSAAAPAPVRRTLPGGLRVIVAERKDSPLVAIDLRIRTGSAAETPQNNGVAHFIEHMVFKGTAARRPGDIDAAIESLGGELTARTNRDWSRYTVTLPAAGWREALSVMADMLLRPAFRPEDIEAERKVILGEMDAAHFEPMRVGLAALETVAFASEDPYRMPVTGPPENVRQLGRDDLLAFWQAHYRPANMTLAVVGDVRSASEVFEAAEALFSGRTGAAAAAAPPDTTGKTVSAMPPASSPEAFAPFASNRRVETASRVTPGGLVTVIAAFAVPSLRSPRTAAVLDALLPILARGGGGGAPGRLSKALGPGVSLSAELITLRRAPGLLLLALTGPRDEAAAMERDLTRALLRLREDGVSEEEAEEAARAALGQWNYNAQTVEGLAQRLAFYDALDAFDFIGEYPVQVASLTAGEVNQALRVLLDPERSAAFVIAGGAPSSARLATHEETSKP